MGCQAKNDLTHVAKAELPVISMMGKCKASFDMITTSRGGYLSTSEHTRKKLNG